MIVSGTSHVPFQLASVVSMPSINGTPLVGTPTTYTPGFYGGSPTITVQWLLSGSPIAGATGTTYTPVSSDQGSLRLQVEELATLPSGTITNKSSAKDVDAAPVQLSNPSVQSAPPPQVGVACPYSQGAFTGFPAPVVTQQWRRNGSNIVGATGPTYTPVAGDAGTQISVVQTETNTFGSTSGTSLGVLVNQPPAFTSAPAIVGTPSVGVATSYTQGTTTGVPTPTITQQWVRNGADISGATAATYTPVSGDAGTTLAVRQIATNIVGTATNTSAGVTVAGGGAGFVSWTAVSTATGYKVYWDTNGGPPYANVADAGNVTSFTPTGLISGTTYYVNVRAYDLSGVEGPYGTQLQKVAP